MDDNTPTIEITPFLEPARTSDRAKHQYFVEPYWTPEVFLIWLAGFFDRAARIRPAGRHRIYLEVSTKDSASCESFMADTITIAVCGHRW